MNETRRWAISLILGIVLAFGGNYWISSINQAQLDVKVAQIEQDVSKVDAKADKNAINITQNLVAITEVNQGWKSVAKAVEANTLQLTRFTEVLIRLEEREKIGKAE